MLKVLTWNQYFVLKFYYVIFTIAYLYRVLKHKSDGIISRRESKPASFKWKVFLQILMVIVTLIMCVEDLIDNWNEPIWFFWNALYLGPAALWILSLHL